MQRQYINVQYCDASKSQIWFVWGYLYKYSQNIYYIPILSMLQSHFIIMTSEGFRKNIGLLICVVCTRAIYRPRPTWECD